jgi:hypothetical protein
MEALVMLFVFEHTATTWNLHTTTNSTQHIPPQKKQKIKKHQKSYISYRVAEKDNFVLLGFGGLKSTSLTGYLVVTKNNT